MKKNIYTPSILVIFLAACTNSKEERILDQRILAEIPTHESHEIANQGAQTFSDMSGVSEEIRLRLLQINLETADQAQLIETQILQTKSILFKTLATPNYKKSDINKLKKKLVKLDHERLDLMFRTIERVESVLEEKTERKEEIYKKFYLE